MSGAQRACRKRASRAGVALALVAACAAPPPDRPGPAAAEPARRVAVLAPGAAETLAALGRAEAVVAIGDFVSWPPALAGRPRVGSYDAPNVERLLALDVDLLVTTAGIAGRGGRAKLESLGVRVLELDTSTFAGALDGIERLGAELGAADAAARLARTVRAEVDAVRARAAGAPRRRVLVVVGRDPLYVAGPGSHFDELVVAAGGANIAADALAPYQLVSLEAMLERRPEVIVDTSDNRPGAPRGALAGAWGAWPFLPAVADGRVFHVDPSRIAIPGPRLGQMAALFGRLIHPERFGDPAPEDFLALGATEAATAPDATTAARARDGAR